MGRTCCAELSPRLVAHKCVYLILKIAKFQNSAASYGDERIIYQYANCERKAVHEVQQCNGRRKAVERVLLASLADTHPSRVIWDLRKL